MIGRRLIVGILLFTVAGCGSSSAVEPIKADFEWSRQDLNVVAGPVDGGKALVVIALNSQH